MCDLTDQFQQTLLLLRKDPEVTANSKVSQLKQNHDQNTRTVAFRDMFASVRQLYTTVIQMTDILQTNRKGYVNVRNPLSSSSSSYEDTTRDDLDCSFEYFQQNLVTTSMKIRLQCTQDSKISSQMKEHSLNALQLVENLGKKLCKTHDQMKRLRNQRSIVKQKVFRLSSDLPEIPSESQLRNRLNVRSNSQSDSDVDCKPISVTTTTTKAKDYHAEQGLLNNEQEMLLNQLTEEEMQAFQEENEHLYDELNALNEEVKNIEGQVVEIAQLQELFTEKVLQQEQELNRVNMTAIGTTENIKGGNQHLRDAMRKNAGFRVWILFFIIGLGFVILFLDWYNP